MVRLIVGEGRTPTHVLGTVENARDLIDAIRDPEIRNVVGGTADTYHFLLTGYIELEKEEVLSFRLLNASCLVDGVQIGTENPRSRVTFEKWMEKGRHRLEISRQDLKSLEPDFSIKKSDGGSCLFYSPQELEAELAKPIRTLSGGSVKGVQLIRSRK